MTLLTLLFLDPPRPSPSFLYTSRFYKSQRSCGAIILIYSYDVAHKKLNDTEFPDYNQTDDTSKDTLGQIRDQDLSFRIVIGAKTILKGYGNRGNKYLEIS